jgi:hypothetical protein
MRPRLTTRLSSDRREKKQAWVLVQLMESRNKEEGCVNSRIMRTLAIGSRWSPLGLDGVDSEFWSRFSRVMIFCCC